MNFLAHLHLSGESEEISVGNFIADFVKGNQIRAYEKNIQNGILIHREIDRFTDSHPIVKRSKDRLRRDYRHYVGVIVDVYYDHFLSKNWSQFHPLSLKEFTVLQYVNLSKYQSIFPERAKSTLYHMSQTDWLYHYQFVEGIDRALKGLAKRTSFESGMEFASHNLIDHYNEFEEEFFSFFPLLEGHIENYTYELIAE